MYKVIICYTEEVAYESDDIYNCIEFIKEKELKDYHGYLDYVQSFIDNYTIDDGVCADFYPSYYLNYKDKVYDISNINSLVRSLDS